jgi:succinoglycan biosynthesis transport protein ExoP
MSENDIANVAIGKKEVALPERRPQTLSPIIEAQSLEVYSSLRSYRDIFFKQLWLILSVAFALTALVTTYSFVTKPEYRATARLLVEPDNPAARTLEDLFSSTPANDDTFLSTQVDLLQSGNLSWQTIEQLQLPRTPEFAPYINTPKDKTPKGQAPGDTSPSSVGTIQLLGAFRERLIVERKRDTRMIEVSFDSHDPELAARVVNTLVNNYVEYNARMKYDTSKQTTGWMAQQLDELKKKVESSQQALVDYERKNSILNTGNNVPVPEQQLADLSRDLTQAQSERMERESQLLSMQVGVVYGNPTLQKLEERDAELKEQYAEALSQYGESFPKVLRIQGQIDEVQTLIEGERKRTLERLRNDFDASKKRETLLAAAITRQKAEVGNFAQLSIQHNMLQREFLTNQQLYENLLERLKNTTVSAGLKATNIHVVDAAVPMPFAIRPKKLRNMATGLLAGLILGFLAAMVRETLDNSIKSAAEVEMLVGAPALALIPYQNGLRLHAHAYRYLRSVAPMGTAKDEDGASLLRKRPMVNGENKSVELSVLLNPDSPISEAFRALRTSILLSTGEHAPQAILVTSAQPDAGKTCVSLNLAFALAHKGRRVLILDADFRRPGIAARLGLNNQVGLSNTLRGEWKVEGAFRQLPTLKNLWVLPSGPCPRDPAELLSPPGMDHLLRTLRQQFTHVIVDSPPVLLVTDAAILSSMVDGVVIVVENEKTGRDALLRTCRILSNSRARILGVVLNKVDTRRDGSYEAYTKENRDQDSYPSAGPT